MCSPAGLVSNALSTLMNVGSQAITYSQNKKIQDYKTQIALNNVETQKNQAKEVLQEGIEDARDKKTNAIIAQASLNAQNAANGFDILSGTNLYNSEDLLDTAEVEGRQIKEKAASKADNYLKSAQNTLNSLKAGTISYNTNLMNSLVSLGQTTSVSNIWNTDDEREWSL